MQMSLRETDGLDAALAMVADGLMRVDASAGMVYQTFATSLYTYERPVGALNVAGYVVLSLGKGKPQLYAHRLIWAVATGEMPTAPLVVNHRNGVKHDNRLGNLELVSQAENIRHAYRTGLAPSGERHVLAKLSDDDVRRIYALSFSESSTVGEVAARFGVSTALVSVIWSGKHRLAKAA